MKNSWKDLKRSIKVLKCIHAWNISKFCIKIKTVRVWRNQPYVPCFKSLKMCMVAPSSLLDCTCRMLIRPSIETSRAIRRNLFRLWSQRSVVDIKRHEYIICNLFYKKNILDESWIRHKGHENWSWSTIPSSRNDLWEPWSNFENWNGF